MAKSNFQRKSEQVCKAVASGKSMAEAMQVFENSTLTAAYEVRDLMYDGMDKSKRQTAYDTLRYMVDNNELKGFAADVARTVVNADRCSPKQFAIIEQAARKLPYSHS